MSNTQTKTRRKRTYMNHIPTLHPFASTADWLSGMQVAYGSWPRCGACAGLFDEGQRVIWTDSEANGGRPVHVECRKEVDPE